jgi:hypothetical protein
MQKPVLHASRSFALRKGYFSRQQTEPRQGSDNLMRLELEVALNRWRYGRRLSYFARGVAFENQ